MRPNRSMAIVAAGLRSQADPCMSNQGELSTIAVSSAGRRSCAHSGTVRPPVEWADTTTDRCPSRWVMRHHARSISA